MNYLFINIIYFLTVSLKWSRLNNTDYQLPITDERGFTSLCCKAQYNVVKNMVMHNFVRLTVAWYFNSHTIWENRCNNYNNHVFSHSSTLVCSSFFWSLYFLLFMSVCWWPHTLITFSVCSNSKILRSHQGRTTFTGWRKGKKMDKCAKASF